VYYADSFEQGGKQRIITSVFRGPIRKSVAKIDNKPWIQYQTVLSLYIIILYLKLYCRRFEVYDWSLRSDYKTNELDYL